MRNALTTTARAARTAAARATAPRTTAPARDTARTPASRTVFVSINGSPVAPVSASLADFTTPAHFALDIVAALAWAATGIVPTSLLDVGSVKGEGYRGRFKAGRQIITFAFKGSPATVEPVAPAPVSAEPAPKAPRIAKAAPVAPRKPVTPQVAALPGMSPLGLKPDAKPAQLPLALPAPAVAADMKAAAATARAPGVTVRVEVEGHGTFDVPCFGKDLAEAGAFASRHIAARVAQYHGWPRAGVDYATRAGATFAGSVSFGSKRQPVKWARVGSGSEGEARPLPERAGMGGAPRPATRADALAAAMGLKPAGAALAEAEAKAKAAGVRLSRTDKAAAMAVDAARATSAAGRAPVTAAPRMNAANAAIFEAAARGVLPPAPDFTAETHARYRGKLAELVAMVKRGDVAALKAYHINAISTSPKALDRYRNAAVIALTAKADAKAARAQKAA